MAANRLFFVLFLVVLTICNGISAAENEKAQPTTTVDNKTSVDNSTKQLIDSLGPSQDYADYEIPKELAPDGVAVVEDYTPIGPAGAKDPLAQPEADKDLKTSPASSASRSSSTIMAVVGLVGGATLFFL